MPKTFKVGGSEYAIADLTAKDYFRLKDTNQGESTAIAMNTLISKALTKDGKPIEIHEAGLLPIKVGSRFVQSLTIPEIKPLDGLPVEETEEFELENKTFAVNPDAVTDDFSKYLSAREKQPGTAIANLIRACLVLDSKAMTPKVLNGFSYGEAIALEQWAANFLKNSQDTSTS